MSLFSEKVGHWLWRLASWNERPFTRAHVYTQRGRDRYFPTCYQEVWQLLCFHFCSTTLLIGRQLICIVYLMKPTMRVSKPFRSEAPGRGHGSGCWFVLDEEVNSMRSRCGTAVLWAPCGSGWLGPVLWAGGQRARGLGRTEGGVTDSEPCLSSSFFPHSCSCSPWKVEVLVSALPIGTDQWKKCFRKNCFSLPPNFLIFPNWVFHFSHLCFS